MRKLLSISRGGEIENRRSHNSTPVSQEERTQADESRRTLLSKSTQVGPEEQTSSPKLDDLALSSRGSDLAEKLPCGNDCPLRELSSKLANTKLAALLMPTPSAWQEQERFEYKPLKPWQTRLVKFLPVSSDGVLRFDLLTVEFIDMEGVGISETGEIITYTALSYAWGSSEMECAAQCNGSPLLISRSLAQALHYLSRSPKGRYLWCDGICIDQANITEKSYQVAQMLRVFEKAESVVAWMGELSQDTRIALKMLPRHLDFALRCRDQRSHTSQCENAWKTMQRSLATLLKEGIFLRTWVRQEFFAAKALTMAWADEEMEFGLFHSAVTQLRAMSAPTFDNVQSDGLPVPSGNDPRSIATPQYEIIRQNSGHGGIDVRGYVPPARRTRYSAHWLKILQDGTHFNVTDDRDRVYGALGIIMSPSTKLFLDDRPNVNPKMFPIDYNKTVSQVFQDVVKFIINADRNLDALCIFENRRWKSDDLPSWVSDWRKQIPRGFLDIEPDPEDANRTYGLATWQDMNDYGRLTLTGYRLSGIYGLGKVTQVGYFSTIEQSLRKGVHGFFNLKQHSDLDSFLHVVNGSHYVRGLKEDGVDGAPAYFPNTTTLNDIVVMLDGGRWPFVLRELADGTFTFVGPAVPAYLIHPRIERKPVVDLPWLQYRATPRTFIIV